MRSLRARAVVVASVASVLALAGCSGPQTPTLDRSQATAGLARLQASASAAEASRAPVGLDPLPSTARVLLFGDSWAAGVGATSPAAGFGATAFAKYGWKVTVDAFGATGYIAAGQYGHGNYADRLPRHRGENYDLVVFSGGLNDYQSSVEDVVKAVTSEVATARDMFPGAQVLVIGPFWSDSSKIPDGLYGVDQAVSTVAATDRLAHVEALYWLAHGSVAQLINPSANGHPNDAGYQYIVAKFDQQLDTLLR